MQKRALSASLLAFTVVACGDPDFNRPSLLDKPRILAVRADPPQPRFLEATTLSTLLYQPPLDRVADQCPNPGPTTYKWEWCPMAMIANRDTNRFECPFPEAAFQAVYSALGIGPAPSYQLGEGKELEFRNPFPALLLYELCRGDIGSALGGPAGAGSSDAGMGQSVFSCDLPATDVADRPNTPPPSETHPISLNITIMVTVTPACPQLLPEGFSPLIATYSLHLPAQDGIPGNQNPTLSGIFVTENWTEVLDGGMPPAPPTPPTPPDEGPADGGVASDGGVSSDGGGAPVELDGGQPPLPDAGLGHDAPDGAVPLEEDPVVKVKRDKHVGLQLDTDIGIAEHLVVPGSIHYIAKNDQRGTPEMIRYYEHLAFSWYAEAGTFTGRGKGPSTGYVPTPVLLGQDGPPSAQDLENFDFNTTNTWDLPKAEDYGHPTARIIVVVRDGRGGVGWTSRQVALEAQP